MSRVPQNVKIFGLTVRRRNIKFLESYSQHTLQEMTGYRHVPSHFGLFENSLKVESLPKALGESYLIQTYVTQYTILQIYK